VRFADGSEDTFDHVILATGYRAAIGMRGGQVGVDDCGFGRRQARVVSTDQPDLYFVGHNPDIRGGIYTMGRDAKPTAYTPKACSVPTSGSECGKKSGAKTSPVTVPYRKKSYHSMVVPTVDAMTAMAIAGGCHSMGGQQFADDAILIDTRGLSRVLAFDSEHGLITVEGGIQWPDLVAHLRAHRPGYRRGRRPGPSRRNRPEPIR
jgi:hypothetical protein